MNVRKVLEWFGCVRLHSDGDLRFCVFLKPYLEPTPCGCLCCSFSPDSSPLHTFAQFPLEMVSPRDLEVHSKFVLSFSLEWYVHVPYAKEHTEVCQSGFTLISSICKAVFIFPYGFLVCQAICSKLCRKQGTILINVHSQMWFVKLWHWQKKNPYSCLCRFHFWLAYNIFKSGLHRCGFKLSLIKCVSLNPTQQMFCTSVCLYTHRHAPSQVKLGYLTYQQLTFKKLSL